MQRLLPSGAAGRTGFHVRKGRRGRGRGALLLAVGAIAAVGAACMPVTPPPPPPPTVIVYGDSLTTEAHQVVIDTIEDAKPGTRVLVRHFPGTAICDWFDHMEEDGDEGAVAVVLQFTGNDQPCMGNHLPGTALWKTRYTSDADHAVSVWADRGVPVLLVGNPQPQSVTAQPPHPLDEAYALVAAGYPGIATFTAAPAEALSTLDVAPNRFFTYEMDCLPDETTLAACGLVNAGKIAVRTSPLDPHLCPVTNLQSACPEYASGVRRFGEAIGQAAAALVP